MMADSPAMRISQARASAIPAPAAGPGSAAIVGFLTATSAPVKVRCLVRRSATRSSNGVSTLLELLPSSGVDFDPTFCHLNHSRFYSTEVAIASNLLNDDHLAARLGRIDQFHLCGPIDQDGALIDVGLVRDLSIR